MKLPSWWRSALIAVAWGLVAWALVRDLSGRNAYFWHGDLKTLFAEQSAFYEGRYPHHGVTPTPPGQKLVRTDYPPSSFLLAIPWLPPGLGWTGTRVWFSLCQLAASVVVVGFVWRMGRREAPGLAWLLAGGVLAMTGLRADLYFGNYAVLMTATLVGLFFALQGERPVWSAVALTGALLKPQMGWLFVLPLCTRRGWMILAGVGAVLAGSAFAAWTWTEVSPLHFFRSGYSTSLSTISSLTERHSLVTVLVQWGLGPTQALLIGAIAGLGGTFWALRTRLAAADTLTRFAFIGLVNRTSTYHNTCDDLLLVFALVLLGRRAWRDGGVPAWSLFTLLAITVWAPSRALILPPAKFVVVAIWIACAVVICRRAREYTRDEPGPAAPSAP